MPPVHTIPLPDIDNWAPPTVVVPETVIDSPGHIASADGALEPQRAAFGQKNRHDPLQRPTQSGIKKLYPFT